MRLTPGLNRAESVGLNDWLGARMKPKPAPGNSRREGLWRAGSKSIACRGANPVSTRNRAAVILQELQHELAKNQLGRIGALEVMRELLPRLVPQPARDGFADRPGFRQPTTEWLSLAGEQVEMSAKQVESFFRGLALGGLTIELSRAETRLRLE